MKNDLIVCGITLAIVLGTIGTVKLADRSGDTRIYDASPKVLLCDTEFYTDIDGSRNVLVRVPVSSFEVISPTELSCRLTTNTPYVVTCILTKPVAEGHTHIVGRCTGSKNGVITLVDCYSVSRLR